jgi:hypothetical protein
VENKSQTLATKEDLAREISRLDLRISESKVDLIKWMFAFWVTLVLMLIGLYLKK